MARVTVEDCVRFVPNRFELVILAARRVRSIHSGAKITVERQNDKNSVVALREIGEPTINAGDLKEQVMQSFQTVSFSDQPEEEDTDLDLTTSGNWHYSFDQEPNLDFEGDLDANFEDDFDLKKE